MTRRAGCQKATTELSLQNLQLLSHLRYPMDTRQLTSPQGEADGVSDGGMTLQALGGVNSPCGWYRVRGQLPSTGGQEHTHTLSFDLFNCAWSAWLGMSGFVSVGYTPQTTDICVCCQHVKNIGLTFCQQSRVGGDCRQHSLLHRRRNH